MPIDPLLGEVAQSEGNALEIRVYKANRRCRICKCLLSIYNPGPCCHADADKWYKIEMREHQENYEATQRKAHAKCVAKMKRKALKEKEKRNGKK